MGPEEILKLVGDLADLAKRKGLAGVELQSGDLKIEFGFVKSETKNEEKPADGNRAP